MTEFLRKRKTKLPCEGCGLHADLCLCAEIPTLDLKTRICLVIHHRELSRTTNTGTLALRALPNSEMRIRGLGRESLDLGGLLQSPYETLLFYPSDDAVELNSEFMAKLSKPVQLIVPDGNWRQASKVHYRHQELGHIPRVMIKKPNPFTVHLRAESSSYGMSTLHAIAEALGIIEGEAVRESLLKLYRTKLSRTLAGRGQDLGNFCLETQFQ